MALPSCTTCRKAADWNSSNGQHAERVYSRRGKFGGGEFGRLALGAESCKMVSLQGFFLFICSETFAVECIV